jgi:hypothetical protein
LACTETYVSLDCPVINKRLTRNPIKIKIPNGSTIESTHVAEIDLPMLRPAAGKAHIVPALDNCSLLLLGQYVMPATPSYSRPTLFVSLMMVPPYLLAAAFHQHVAHRIA